MSKSWKTSPAKHEVPKLILEYRSLVKLKNTYLDNLTEYVNPRQPAESTPASTRPARHRPLELHDPNLQNIPIRTDEGRRIRLAFVPGDPEKRAAHGRLPQIELRVLAHFTQEPALVKAFAQDEDIHRTVAAEVFGVAPEQVTREQRDAGEDRQLRNHLWRQRPRPGPAHRRHDDQVGRGSDRRLQQTIPRDRASSSNNA